MIFASMALVACSSGGDGVVNTPAEDRYDLIHSNQTYAAVTGIMGAPTGAATPSGACAAATGKTYPWATGTGTTLETITVKFDCSGNVTEKTYSGVHGVVSASGSF